jgi:hypothetical protein
MKTVLLHFNGDVGKKPHLYPACGGHSLHNETNDNGKRTVNFALGRDSAVTETWYQHKDIHKVTCRSPEDKIYKQTEYTLVVEDFARMFVMSEV